MAVLVPALLAVSWLASEARHLRLEASIDLLSPEDALARADRERRQQFGEDFRLLAALYRSDRQGGILSRDSLLALSDLHRTLAAEPGIREVASLASAPALVASPDTPAGSPVLTDEALDDPHLLLRRLRASRVQEAMLLAMRRSLAPVFLELDPKASEADVTRRVLALAAEVESRHPGAGVVLVVGPAVVETTLSGHVFDDLSRLVPFAVALVACGLLLAFWQGTLLFVAMVHALALEAAVLGGMAACGWSVNLVSVLAPVILVPVGVADLLHLFVHLTSTGAGRVPSELLAGAFTRLERPMVTTSATTALGFLSFVLSPVAAIRQFGLTLSAGAVVALVLTFTLDAAILALLWHPRADRAARAARPRLSILERWLLGQRAPSALRRRSRIALALCALLALVSASALPGLHIEDTWIRNFDPESRLIRDTLRFESEYLGTNMLALVIEADPTVPGADSRALDLVNRFTTSHTVALGLRGILSPTLLARSLDPEQGWSWKSWPTPTPEALGEAAATWQRRGMALPRMRTFLDPGLDRFQIQVFVLDQPYRSLVECLSRVVKEAEGLAGPGVAVTTSGNLAVNVRMVRLAVLGQAVSLGVLLVTVTLLMAGLTRSPASAAVLVLPMVLAILATFFLLVTLGLPYGIAVSMFPPLVVGLSVDFAIHLQAVLARRRGASRTRWARDVAVAVRGILLNGMLWAGGFAVLAVSSLPPNRYLGLLCSAVVALSTVLTLLVLPNIAVTSK